MKKLSPVTFAVALSFMTFSASAFYGDLPGLELRNVGPKSVMVQISERSLADAESAAPITIEVPARTGDKSVVVSVNHFKDANIRYGTVTVTRDGETVFDHLIDLSSEISVCTDGRVLHNFRGTLKGEAGQLPEWLYTSATVTPFDLSRYSASLIQQWNGLTDEQKKDHYQHLPDFPSCLHSVDLKPKLETPYPYCFRGELKTATLKRYAAEHGLGESEFMNQSNISEDSLRTAEGILSALGLPIFQH